MLPPKNSSQGRLGSISNPEGITTPQICVRDSGWCVYMYAEEHVCVARAKLLEKYQLHGTDSTRGRGGGCT